MERSIFGGIHHRFAAPSLISGIRISVKKRKHLLRSVCP
jgi:hypothetical protein